MTPLKHPNAALKCNSICTYFVHKKITVHSINELLEIFGFPEE